MRLLAKAVDWLDLDTDIRGLTDGPILFEDTNLTRRAQRFYRFRVRSIALGQAERSFRWKP